MQRTAANSLIRQSLSELHLVQVLHYPHWQCKLWNGLLVPIFKKINYPQISSSDWIVHVYNFINCKPFIFSFFHSSTRIVYVMVCVTLHVGAADRQSSLYHLANAVKNAIFCTDPKNLIRPKYKWFNPFEDFSS